jgi:DNA-binding PadR family transcriptional regulator
MVRIAKEVLDQFKVDPEEPGVKLTVITLMYTGLASHGYEVSKTVEDLENELPPIRLRNVLRIDPNLN